jgi:hypothetical protein
VDLSRLPQGGAQGLPPGAQGAGRTPGTNEKRSWAGARDLPPGTTPPGGARKTPGVSRDLRAPLDRASPARAFAGLAVVVDTSPSHSAGEGEQWLAAHPRFHLLFLPPSCPQANPSERACGAVPDQGPRNPTRKRLGRLVRDAEQPLQANGPWPSVLSELYYTPEVTAAVEALLATETAPQELSHLAARVYECPVV